MSGLIDFWNWDGNIGSRERSNIFVLHARRSPIFQQQPAFSLNGCFLLGSTAGLIFIINQHSLRIVLSST